MDNGDIKLIDANLDRELTMPVAAYNRETAPSFIPRFNTGKLGDNDDDLTQHKTISFSGGAFQVLGEEDNKVLRLQGVYDRRKNELRPMQTATSINTGSVYTAGTFFSAWTTNGNLTFVAVRESTTNKLYKIDSAGTCTAITLPVALSGSTIEIMDLIFHKEYLYTCGQSATVDQNCQRYNYQANTWQDITGAVVKYAVVRNILYGMNRVGVFSCTNETAAGAATWTFLKYVGPSDPTGDLPTGFKEFNGAGWITKPSGMYRFDGVDVVKFLDQTVEHLCKFNGALYYMIRKVLWRTDGSNIEMIQDLNEVTSIIGLAPHRAWLAFMTSSQDTAFGFAGTYQYFNLHLFDGSMWQTIYKKINTSIKPGLYPLISAADNLLIGDQTVNLNAASFLKIPTDTLNSVRSFQSVVSIITSDLDFDTPSVFKTLERLDLNFLNLGASDTITVYRQYFNGVSWDSEWQLLGSLTTASTVAGAQRNYINAFGENLLVKFKKARFGFEITTAASSTFTLSDVSIHYLSSPRHRWRWNVGFKAERNMIGNTGADVTSDGVELTADQVNAQISQMLYTAQPVWFRDVDHNSPTGAYTNSATSIVVTGHVPFAGSNSTLTGSQSVPLYYLAEVGNEFEILQLASTTDNGNNTTTLVFETRGVFTVALPFTTATRLYPLYRTQLTRILRDAYIPTPETLGADPLDTDREHDLLIELTEV